MDDKQREAFQIALDQALQEKAKLDTTIDYLREKLGAGAPSGMVKVDRLSATPGLALDPSSLVSDGEFFGLSGTKASKTLLERVGRARPLSTDELFAAVKKGGAKIGGRETLYKVLHRDRATFQPVGGGRWGLRVWYPPSRVRAPSDDLADEEAGAEQQDERGT